MNVLIITLDQFRGDSYGAAGHPLVRTPTLDRIAGEGVRLERDFSQSAPCAPGRAALYTGTYLMNNRVVANGTPLPGGLDNIAKAARRAGYDPTLFGYTDQGLDPNRAEVWTIHASTVTTVSCWVSPLVSTCPKVRLVGCSTFAPRATTCQTVGSHSCAANRTGLCRIHSVGS